MNSVGIALGDISELRRSKLQIPDACSITNWTLHSSSIVVGSASWKNWVFCGNECFDWQSTRRWKLGVSWRLRESTEEKIRIGFTGWVEIRFVGDLSPSNSVNSEIEDLVTWWFSRAEKQISARKTSHQKIRFVGWVNFLITMTRNEVGNAPINHCFPNFRTTKPTLPESSLWKLIVRGHLTFPVGISGLLLILGWVCQGSFFGYCLEFCHSEDILWWAGSRKSNFGGFRLGGFEFLWQDWFQHTSRTHWGESENWNQSSVTRLIQINFQTPHKRDFLRVYWAISDLSSQDWFNFVVVLF